MGGARELMRQFGPSVGVLAANVVGLGVAFGVQLVLARALGSEDYGRYALVWSWITLLVVGVKFGTETGASKYLPSYWHTDKEAYYGFVRFALLLVTLLGAAGLLVVGYVIPWLTAGGDMRLRAAYAVGAALLPAYAILWVLMGILQARGHTVLSRTLHELVRPSVLMLLLGVALLSGSSRLDSAAVPLLLHGLAIGATVMVGAVLAWRASGGRVVASGRIDGRTWLPVLASVTAIGMLNTALQRSDVVFVGVLASARDAGIYAVANRLAMFAGLPLAAATWVASPKFFSLFEKGSTTELQEIVRSTARFAAMMGAPIMLVLLVGSRTILRLFGPDFPEGATTLTWLLIGQAANVLAGPVAALLMMTGGEATVLRVTLIVGIGTVLLFLGLIPMWGAEGAAITRAFSLIVLNVVLFFSARRSRAMNTSVF